MSSIIETSKEAVVLVAVALTPVSICAAYDVDQEGHVIIEHASTTSTITSVMNRDLAADIVDHVSIVDATLSDIPEPAPGAVNEAAFTEWSWRAGVGLVRG